MRFGTRFSQHRLPASIRSGSAILLALLTVFFAPANAQEVPGGCGSLTQSWGPFDYRPDRYIPENTYRSHRALLGIVEQAHFTPEVEMLTRGKTSTTPGNDISYTLGVFPNHHRALMAMAALGDKEKTEKPYGARFPVDCYFRRAVAWRPDDNIVHMLYARYLAKAKRIDEAEQQLGIAASQAKDNPMTHNNLGLIYFDMKNYGQALVHAHKAYALGLGMPNLRQQLQSVGKWEEPGPQTAVVPAINSQ
ncbi:MAG: ABC transporter permease [Rhodoferax sp.]